ncbi:MAG: phage holin family protein [Gammaproteobacteria bacterium]|nr:phage holin family protein [Gammaproteobacteria bacterium]
MAGFLVRTLITALGLWLADAILPGIAIETPGTLILAALLMGLVNALVRPIAIVLTFPITMVTLGLFLLVINAAMFGLVAAFLEGFRVSGFFAALFGWLIVSFTSMVASWCIGPNGRYEVLIIERRR